MYLFWRGRETDGETRSTQSFHPVTPQITTESAKLEEEGQEHQPRLPLESKHPTTEGKPGLRLRHPDMG